LLIGLSARKDTRHQVPRTQSAGAVSTSAEDSLRQRRRTGKYRPNFAGGVPSPSSPVAASTSCGAARLAIAASREILLATVLCARPRSRHCALSRGRRGCSPTVAAMTAGETLDLLNVPGDCRSASTAPGRGLDAVTWARSLRSLAVWLARLLIRKPRPQSPCASPARAASIVG